MKITMGSDHGGLELKLKLKVKKHLQEALDRKNGRRTGRQKRCNSCEGS